MRIVVAPDKYGGTLTAAAAAAAIGRGWARRAPADRVVPCPVADGGAGTVGTLAAALGVAPRETTVTGPLGPPVPARWLVVDAGATAIVEAAEACGLHLVPEPGRDPRRATSAGVGELILAALDAGVRRIVVGLGGTATVDAGAGCLVALGAGLVDAAGAPLEPGGAALARLARMELAGLDPRLAAVEVVAATDVDVPLLGPDGAALGFAPQKGADPEAVRELDAALSRFAEIAAGCRADAIGVADLPGGGAAGGLAAGLVVACAAAVRRGADLVIDRVGLPRELARADLVVTGEGCFDAQSLRGKAPLGVARAAQRAGIPCLLLAGQVQAGRRELAAAGIDAAYAVADLAGSVEESLAAPVEWLEELAARVAGEWSRS